MSPPPTLPSPRQLQLTCHCSCFVRARRLNVIIQPHLRFVYELMKWDEYLQKMRGEPIKRELEWATVAREIAAMNKPYSRA
jgi:dual specificity MAP kinase phosphatase